MTNQSSIALDLFQEIKDALAHRHDDVRATYLTLYRMFVGALVERTSMCALDFSGPFARMNYLCKFYGIDQKLYAQINAFRARCRAIDTADDKVLASTLARDVKALCDFISAVYGVAVPDSLVQHLPAGDAANHLGKLSGDYMRLVVDEVTDRYLLCTSEEPTDDRLKIDYTSPTDFGDWTYVADMVQSGTQINVVRPRLKDGVYYPELIIVEPDLLVDISSVASCFDSCATSHLLHLVHKFKPAPNSEAILLGNFASQLLDEAVRGADNAENRISYEESTRRFFKNNALALASCDNLTRNFHTEAKNQQQNLNHMVQVQFREIMGLIMDDLILEPSFFCEMLGLQGRMDLLQSDLKVLMEQKSGKRAWGDVHVEKHYVQVLLYQALLHYNYGLKNSEISSFLLYSKYPDGLIRESTAPKLLFEAIRVRNAIAQHELMYANGEVASVLDGLTADSLNEKNLRGRFWDEYIRPQLNEVLMPIHNADALERAYFYRMFTFVEKENIQSKLGSPRQEISGFAATWNSSLSEKLQAGTIFHSLRIDGKTATVKEGGGIDEVTLSMTSDYGDFSPNFRAGDIVILYSYKADCEPDARRAMVLRGSLKDIKDGLVKVRLRAPQKNESVLEAPEGYLWAIEHDFIEASYASLYRGLHSFLRADKSRRDLLLNRRVPRIDRNVALTGDYGDFNELVLKAKQAQDYFLLIGPPGTGKTSFGLMNILKEHLADGTSSVLLVSYTNRAVDEICSKLERDEIDYVRIGSDLSCDEAYKQHLIGNRVDACNNKLEIKSMVARTRVFVATTAALGGNSHIFALKHFSLAIIDEASQILEPHLLALICAKHGDENAIDKFVMIGDHKQLPAVVQQSAALSAVDDADLNNIGLKDCRQSLFERLLLLQSHNDNLRYALSRQGRMHPEVSEYSNRAFYQGMLSSIPLPHQQGDLELSAGESGIEQLLAKHRLAFLASEFRNEALSSEKCNMVEAQMIAATVKAYWDLMKRNGIEFDSAKSVGVIVPYRNQITLIRKEIDKYGIDELHDISIDTVERFQGSERDLIIYGFTIHKPYQLSFLSSNVIEDQGEQIDRKLNVALTRARKQLIVVGNPELLERNELFSNLMQFFRIKNSYYDIGCSDYCRGNFAVK